MADYLKNRIAKWQNQNFAPLASGQDVHAIVSNLNYHFDVALSPVELQALTNAVFDFINAYHSGTFENFTTFRIPVKNFHFIEGVRNAMQNHFSISAKTIRDNPEMAWKQYWDATIKDSYTNYWVGLSLTNSEIRVENSTCPTNDLFYFVTRGSPTFTVDSIADITLLARKLRGASEKKKVFMHVKSHLSPATSDILFGGHGGLEEARAAVVEDLNRLIQNGPIYDSNLFEGVRLSPETKNLLKQNPKGKDLVRLNRFLLVDAFPDVLRPGAWLENAGISMHSPAICVEPTREEVSKATGGLIKVATMRILPKPRGTDPSYPVYLRWYWSPQDQKWLPEQLVVMFSGPRGRDLFF